VADFFLRPQVDVSALLSYIETNQAFDPKQRQCLEFFARFYRGMKFIEEKSPARAKEELELAMNSDQRQFVEYWIARNECTRIP